MASERSFEISNIRINIRMGALVLIHRNGVSGDFEQSFKIVSIRGKIRTGAFALTHRDDTSGDFA